MQISKTSYSSKHLRRLAETSRHSSMSWPRNLRALKQIQSIKIMTRQRRVVDSNLKTSTMAIQRQKTMLRQVKRAKRKESVVDSSSI